MARTADNNFKKFDGQKMAIRLKMGGIRGGSCGNLGGQYSQPPNVPTMVNVIGALTRFFDAGFCQVDIVAQRGDFNRCCALDAQFLGC